MPLITSVGSIKNIDLCHLNSVGFKLLDAQDQPARVDAAKLIVSRISEEVILEAITHLSKICFDLHGSAFIRAGSRSFLADILKAYVEKHDGHTLARAYYSRDVEALHNFKFSEPSRKLFQLLHKIALDTDHKECIEYLPSNISNKIWIPIIDNRPPPKSFFRFSCFGVSDEARIRLLQQLANNTVLLKAIFEKACNMSVDSGDAAIRPWH